MNEKVLLKKLKELNNIKPDSSWKNSYREILLNQIKGAKAEATVSQVKIIRNLFPDRFFKLAAQPVALIIILVITVFGGGIFGLQAAKDTIPGDSLYIAKRVSEKTQLVFTFNDKDKARLGIEFAGKRAEELARVLAEPNNQAAKQEKVDELTKNYKKEIQAAKTRIQRFTAPDTKLAKNESLIVAEESIGISTSSQEDESMPVFSANLGKEEQGIQVSGGGQEQTKTTSDSEDRAETELETEETTTATGTEAKAVTEPAAEEKKATDPQAILAEAAVLLEHEDYNGTLDKLDEASTIFNGDSSHTTVEGDSDKIEGAGEDSGATTTVDKAEADDTGEVKGVEESVEEATSTVE